jgi:hypothetical protein
MKERAESPKEDSPGQSESASDALGQLSIEFPSPARAAEFFNARCECTAAIAFLSFRNLMAQISVTRRPRFSFALAGLKFLLVRLPRAALVSLRLPWAIFCRACGPFHLRGNNGARENRAALAERLHTALAGAWSSTQKHAVTALQARE